MIILLAALICSLYHAKRLPRSQERNPGDSVCNNFIKKSIGSNSTNSFEKYAGKTNAIAELGGTRWLSKSGAHILFYRVLSKVFPNAKIVRLHRDPCESIPSFASFLGCNWQIYSNKLFLKEAGKQVLDMYKFGMAKAMEGDKLIEKDRFIDIHFRDIVKKPIETLTAIYKRFNYPLSENLIDKWQAYLDAHPKDRTGKHVYTLESVGLSKDLVHSELQDYLAWLKATTGRLV